jgi:hypothetical protein
MTLEALSKSSGTTVFTVNFNDTDGDHKLDLGEVTGFSGIDLGVITATGVTGIPDLPGLAECGGESLPTCTFWKFSPGAIIVQATTWDYRVTGEQDTRVPIPGTLLLLLPPLAALGVLRRRRS